MNAVASGCYGLMVLVLASPSVAQEVRSQPQVPRNLAVATPPAAALQTYVVQMKAEPGARYKGGVIGLSATAPAAGERYDTAEQHVQAYTSYLVTTHEQALAAVHADGRKIYSYRHALNGFAARLTADQARALKDHPGVQNVWPDRLMEIDTNNSSEFLGLLDAREGLRTELELQGEDVIVGVLDSGAIPEHPSFTDTDPQALPSFCNNPRSEAQATRCQRFRARRAEVVYSAPPARWKGVCQTGEGWSEQDCNNKLIGARWFVEGFINLRGGVADTDFLSARDASGHGSHTAATAAGNPVTASLGNTPLTTVSGVAPRARLAIYKVCWQTRGSSVSCAFSDSAAATDAAVADGVDVLNFSVGTAPSFNDPQDLAFLDAVAAGVSVARSGGNSGPRPSSTNAGSPWVTTVAASTQTGEAFSLAALVQEPPTVAGGYPAVEGAVTQPLSAVGSIREGLVAARPIDACRAVGNVFAGKIALVSRGGCSFVIKIANVARAGAGAILVYTDDRPKTVMGGAATSVTRKIPGVMIDNAIGRELQGLLAAGSGVVVSLGAGNYISESLDGNVMASFSSRGPFRTQRDWIKPDITAPGVRILAAYAPEPGAVRGPVFNYLQGTSMSSPQIAGLSALIQEAHPTWSPAQIKSALMTTARQGILKEDGETPADAFDFGAGHVDPNKAVNPGLTYNAGHADYLAASCGTDTPLTTPTDCRFLSGTLGLSTDPADLNLPSIGIGRLPGRKTVTRTVTAVADFEERAEGDDDDDRDDDGDDDGSRGAQDDDDDDEEDGRAPDVASLYRATVEAPPGFSVEVSPATLELSPGMSASYEVTIINASAPPGQWAFGALTWHDNAGHRVRTPVAVNGIAFLTPDSFLGVGARGGAQLSVTFGYTGPYVAQAHDLADPGQTVVNPQDDPNNRFVFLGPGVEIAYLGELGSDVLLAQWSTFDAYTSGNDNIDLHLYYCPNFFCSPVATSTGPSAHETVSITQPRNDPNIPDPYVVFAHAMDTDGGTPAKVMVFDWQVGQAREGGRLQVTPPPQAQVGKTQTVGIAWRGLNTGAGYKQLGAVSHQDANGNRALTLVRVDNDAGGGLCDLVACP